MGQTLRAGLDGAYQWWLDASHSPLTVTVSHTGHQPLVTTGVAVAAQQTTMLDVALRQLIPCAAIDPAGLSAQVRLGEQYTMQLNVGNAGLAALTFEISEISGTLPAGALRVDTIDGVAAPPAGYVDVTPDNNTVASMTGARMMLPVVRRP